MVRVLHYRNQKSKSGAMKLNIWYSNTNLVALANSVSSAKRLKKNNNKKTNGRQERIKIWRIMWMLRTQNVPTIIVILMYVIESQEYRIQNVIFSIFFDITSLNTNLVAVWPIDLSQNTVDWTWKFTVLTTSLFSM